MIAVCQPFATTAQFHLSYDACMLQAVCLAFPGETVTYITDRVNCARMEGRLKDPPANLRLRVVGLPAGAARRFRLRVRLLANLASCRREAINLGARWALYLAFNTGTCALHLVRRGPLPEYYVVHNNFHTSQQTRFGRLLFKWIERRATRLIFIEQAIADAARAASKVGAEKIGVVPIPVEEVGRNRRSVEGQGILLPGVLKEGKGAGTLLAAARILKEESPEVLGRLPVRIVGPYFSGARPDEERDGVCYQERPLTDAELEDEMCAARFVALPYEASSYAYVAPDTAYRALGCGTPLLVSQLPSVARLTQGPEPVGFSFAASGTGRGLADVIACAANMPDEEYAALCDNVRRFVRGRGLEATAERLRQALGEDGREWA